MTDIEILTRKVEILLDIVERLADAVVRDNKSYSPFTQDLLESIVSIRATFEEW